MTGLALFPQPVKAGAPKYLILETKGQDPLEDVKRAAAERWVAAVDEEAKGRINILEKAFRGPITTAINRELNLLRRNSLTGQDLLKNLVRLFHQHNMRDWMDRRGLPLEEQPIPKIVCSEALA